MATHALEYVKTRTPAGTLPRNLTAVEDALRRKEGEAYRLVSTVADVHNGDLIGVLLLFVAD